MKIMHLCLANYYVDNYGYQENILPKHHKLQGHEVKIVASTETYIENSQLGYVKPSEYFNNDGIHVVRLPYVSWLPIKLARKLRFYVGVEEQLKLFEPDIIFLHDIQFFSITTIVKYVKDNPHVRLYADGHTDFINSARTWLSRVVLHKLLYRWCAKHVEPFVSCFFGVTPLRVEFFEKVYLINKSKIKLLVLGVDDSVVDLNLANETRARIRSKLKIDRNDFVVISGGKIDLRKNIHTLMQVVSEMDAKAIKLVIVGTPSEELRSIFNNLSKSVNIITVGWVPAEQIYDYLIAADLGCFPGTHSVLWEQAVGVGLPCIFRKWEGIEHVDIGGNCIMIDKGDSSEINKTLSRVIQDKELYAKMKTIAATKGVEEFSYSKIAKKAIGLD